jgi:outer membrane protein TolC
MEKNAHTDLFFPDEDNNGSSSTVTSQSGTRSRIATWDKDATVNSTVPIFSPPRILFAKRASRAAEQEIDNLRRVLFLARKETHVALQKFNQALEAERKAQAALVVAEDRRSELSASSHCCLFLGRHSAPRPSLYLCGISQLTSPQHVIL